MYSNGQDVIPSGSDATHLLSLRLSRQAANRAADAAPACLCLQSLSICFLKVKIEKQVKAHGKY